MSRFRVPRGTPTKTIPENVRRCDGVGPISSIDSRTYLCLLIDPALKLRNYKPSTQITPVFRKKTSQIFTPLFLDRSRFLARTRVLSATVDPLTNGVRVFSFAGYLGYLKAKISHKK